MIRPARPVARMEADPRPGLLPRSRLVRAILAASAPIRVVEAPAGMGKSVLLDQLSDLTGAAVIRAAGIGPRIEGIVLWDVPDGAPTGEIPVEVAPGAALILAKRPGTAIPGLARARVYGRVAEFGWADLLLGADEIAVGLGLTAEAAVRQVAATGGWPCLLGEGKADGPVLVSFLRGEVLAPLAGPQLVAFEALLTGPPTGPARLDPRLLAGLPFVDPRAPGPLHPVLAAVRAPLLRAVGDEIAARMTDAPAVRAIAVAQAALGDPARAIAALQSIGAWQAALAALREAGGPFFVHRHGPLAFDRMLAGFPADLAQADDLLVLCRALQAVKRGEVPLTRRILRDRWGEGMADAGAVIAARGRYPLEVRFLRFLLCTWEDFDLQQDYLEAAYELLAELPPEEELWRGSFYNAVLEFYIRARRFPEADHAAVRAAGHYARAGVPILSFYIDLHRGIIALFMGDPQAARRFAQGAAGHLARTPYESPGDARLLALLDACVGFEAGDGAALGRFLALDLDGLAQGEIWPSLVELVLAYGPQLLAEQGSTMAARAFLDRWRATGERSRQFQALIDLREAELLQAANRWIEAAALAARVPPRDGADEGLATLQDRDDLGRALVRLRQAVHDDPRRPGLDAALATLLENPHLTARQRCGAELMLAQALRRTGRPAEAQATLRRCLAGIAQKGSVAILRDERGLLADLLASARLREPLERIEPVRRLLRLVQGQGPRGGPGAPDRAKVHGLTRQETRVLHLLCEGAPNKTIATAMGVSGATVKFHLANLYRKLGCSTRREATAAASALGIVA